MKTVWWKKRLGHLKQNTEQAKMYLGKSFTVIFIRLRIHNISALPSVSATVSNFLGYLYQYDNWPNVLFHVVCVS